MDNTISEIISHVDLSSLKDNPQAQAMLMAFLSSTSNTESESDKQSASSPASSETTSVGQEVEKRKFDSIENAQNQTEAALRRVGRKPVTSEDEDVRRKKIKIKKNLLCCTSPMTLKTKEKHKTEQHKEPLGKEKKTMFDCWKKE